MAYKIKCDGYPLLDVRDESLILFNPKVKVEVNTVGEGSFTIYRNHPYYDKLKKLKSVIEVADELGAIFRGRITSDTRDFDNGKAIDLEGAMAYFNDSIIRPYNFPEDFLANEEYLTAQESGNVVAFFLNWLINQHNSQVQNFQKFKLGVVTVADPNNYVTRSDSNYSKTWDVLRQKLFDSELGGYLCIRYEPDGNYIDYLSEFTLTNTQRIDFGKNLLNLKAETDASTTYSAIIPIGAETQVETGEETGETESEAETAEKSKLTLASLEDGDITDDIVKSGDTLYSKRAVEEYGWIYAPIADTTWEDVTEVQNLLRKGTEWLATQGTMLSDTTEITAVDLHFSDAEIRSFRIYRKIEVMTAPHGINDVYNLTRLEIDIANPQNTKITVGKTRLTLTDQQHKEQSSNVEKIERVEKDIEANRTETEEVKNQIVLHSTALLNTCESIIMKALTDFVETGDYSEFRATTEASLNLMSEQLELKFSETIAQIENVNGDLQETNTTLNKFFDFSLESGLIIKVGENQMQLQLDNDVISFKKNGQQFGWWDGVDFHTGNIVVNVNERAQFGDFAFVPRTDGSLSFLKVGG